MLKQMRDQAQNLKWALVLVIASFIASFVLSGQAGLGDVLGIGGATWAAKVGRHEVTVSEFQDALTRQDAMYRQLFGAQYDPQRMLNPSSVLDQLIDRGILLQEAERLGVEPSDWEIAQSIKEITAFQDANGKFEHQLYNDYLDRSRQTAAAFERQVAEDLKVQAVNSLITGGIVPSRSAIEKEWRRENESASIEYVVVPLEPHLASVSPTDEQLQAWFAAHPKDFDAGPAREVRLVRFVRDDFQKKLEVESEMRAYYDENVGSIYTMTEDQRRASVIVFSVPPGASDDEKAAVRAEADAAATRARAGADFAALVTELSDDAATKGAGGDMGPFYRGMMEPAVDEAIFAANEGDVVGPVETLRGFEVFRVTKGAGSKARPFEEVKDLVARGLYAKAASEAMAAAVKSFQEALGKGNDLDKAAEAAGVKATERTWITMDGEIPGIGQDPIVTQKAFDAEVETISEPLADFNGQVVVQVLAKRDSSPQTFDEAREKVLEATRRDQARAKAREEAQAILDAARASGDLAASAPGRSVQTAAAIRQGASVPDLGEAPDLVRAAFATEAGQFGPVSDVPAGVAVFKTTERVGFDEAKFEAARDDVARRLRDQQSSTLREAALEHLRAAYEGKIRRNDKMLAQLGGG